MAWEYDKGVEVVSQLFQCKVDHSPPNARIQPPPQPAVKGKLQIQRVRIEGSRDSAGRKDGRHTGGSIRLCTIPQL